MARIDRLEERKRADRLTARLGQAAAQDPSEPAGGCLSAEQLADVASNSCSADERKAALAHFAACRACYDAWVGISLSLVAMESGLTRRKRPALFSLRNLSYLGSAIAVAASVVVFLNVRQEVDLSPIAPPPAEIRSERLAAEGQSAPAPTARAVGSAPAKPVETREKKAERPHPEAEGKNAFSQGVVERSAPAQLAPMAADQSVEEEIAHPQSASAWLKDISTFCRNRHYPAERWQLLREQGEQLQTGSGKPNDGDGQKVRAVLAVMQTAEGAAAIAEACGAIVPLVAGEGEKE